MDNIIANTSPLQNQTSDLQNKQNKLALIAGLVILIGIISGTFLDLFYMLSQQIYSYEIALIVKLLIMNAGSITAELIMNIPNFILSLYLIFFYKKNPAHAVLKTHYIARIAVNLLGAFVCFVSIIMDLNSYPDQIGAYVLNLSDYTTAMIIAVIFSIIVFTKFRYYKAARIVEIINLASYLIFLIIRFILSPENPKNPLWYIGAALSLTIIAFKIIFWFKCIDADTPSRIPQKKKPVPKPVYVQSVQPVYVQPIQPVYQPLVQPSTVTDNGDAEAKLLKIKHLLDSGLITQEEFEKKRAEIIEKI